MDALDRGLQWEFWRPQPSEIRQYSRWEKNSFQKSSPQAAQFRVRWEVEINRNNCAWRWDNAKMCMCNENKGSRSCHKPKLPRFFTIPARGYICGALEENEPPAPLNKWAPVVQTLQRDCTDQTLLQVIGANLLRSCIIYSKQMLDYQCNAICGTGELENLKLSKNTTESFSSWLKRTCQRIPTKIKRSEINNDKWPKCLQKCRHAR